MNIAFLQRSFTGETREATKITTVNLANELIKSRNRSEIITEGGYLFSKKLSKFETIGNIHVHRPYFFPFAVKDRPLFLYVLNYFLAPSLGSRYVQKKEKIKFDIIHSISAAPIIVLTGYLAKLLCPGAKLVHTIKSESIHGYKFARLLNLADKIITPLETIKNELVKKGCNKNKIEIIRSSINIDEYGPLNKEKMKEKYGFKNKKVIFYFGGFTSNKGVDDLIKAIPLLAKKEPEIEVVMVHPDVIENRYKKMVENLGKYKKNVKMFAKKLNVREYLNAVDLLVLPYRNLKATEANPSCLLEGMACKTPIVTTSLPELKEIVEPDKDVLMAVPGNPKSIAENILKLLNNRKLQKKLTENSYKKVKNFDTKIIAQQHLKLYNSLVR